MKTIELYKCLKCPEFLNSKRIQRFGGGGGGGGGVKLCQTQPGLKLDLVYVIYDVNPVCIFAC